MRGRFISAMVAVCILVSFRASGQGEGGGFRPDRERGARRAGMRMMPMAPSGSGTSIIKTGKDAVYLLVGGLLSAYDAKTLQLLAKKNLDEEGGETAEAPRSAFAKLDRNADGRLTQDELPGTLARLLERADRNADGALTEDEMPQEMGRALRMGMQLAGSTDTPALEVHPLDGAVYAYYNGFFYRLDGQTLQVLAKVKVEIPVAERVMPGMPPMGPPPEGAAPPAATEPLF